MSNVRSGVGANTQRRSTVSSNEAPSQPQQDAPSGTEGLPPQRHAGAVGLGPAYHQGPGFSDKIIGLEEEIKGKITKKPELVEHGHERRTGVLKEKERERDQQKDPFAKPGDQTTSASQKEEGELGQSEFGQGRTGSL